MIGYRVRVRVSGRMLDHLSGSGPWQGETYSGDPVEQAAAVTLFAALKSTRRRADRSVKVDLTFGEIAVLDDYTTTLIATASDDLSDADNLADWNTARTLHRRLAGVAS